MAQHIRTLRPALLVLLPALTFSLAAAQDAPPKRPPSAELTSPLPDPLLFSDGSPVRTADDWKTRRREEVLELFRKHVYGYSPPRPKDLRFKLVEEDRAALEGKATKREVDIIIGHDKSEFTFRLLAYIPNKAAKPVPAFLLLNHRGDVHEQVTLPFFPVSQIVDRGYAAVGITLGQLSPDNKQRYRDGIIGFYDGPEEKSPDAWRTISAWAWGGHRAMDYLETDKDIDARRVAVIGHSRGGKTALWCGAQDERFALTISNDSGEAGAALARHPIGESLEKVNTFTHWFTTNYKSYIPRVNELPVDQHELIALMAPRLVYVASADQDTWADPEGEFLSCVNATPVYRLFGLKGIDPQPLPETGQRLHEGSIGYHLRPGPHGLVEFDWQSHMDFADKHLPRSVSGGR